MNQARFKTMNQDRLERMNQDRFERMNQDRLEVTDLLEELGGEGASLDGNVS